MAISIIKLNESSVPRPVPAEKAGDASIPSLTARLGPGLGAKLLMELFVGERTGKLVVYLSPEAPVGTLFFSAGEPGHVQIDDNGLRLEKRLRDRKVLADKDPGGRARHPIAVLTRRSNPIAMLEALREEVRDFCQKLLALEEGAVEFYDDDEVIERVPLTAVNPFGFVLGSKRRAIPPDALLRVADEIAQQYPTPLMGFANATARLTAFSGGVDLSEHIDGTKRAGEVFSKINLDPLIGALILQTLCDTGLAKLFASPSQSSRDRKRRTSAATVSQADATQLSQLALLPGKGGSDILALYLELKPETDLDAILGIEGSAGPATIERMYQQRLAELDPRAIPASPNRPYLLARVEELRTKVERAYRTRTGTQTRARAAYQILDKIGVGGMAEVFLGHPTDDPHTLIAIKRILPEFRNDPKFSRQFLDEARLARRVQHPNVVQIHAVGKSTDDLYLAMEFIDGLDLGELIKRHRERNFPPPIDIVVRIAAEACAGLHAAHTARDKAGVVAPILHRDVSPQNILVSRMGDVKLSDFGIAKALDSHGDPLDEESGVIKGKIPYLSPELLKQSAPSVQSDVYAMAMTIYAALARLPFSRPGVPMNTMKAILFEPLPRLSELIPDAGVPPLLDALLLAAAARNPEDRHASAQVLQLELEEVLTKRPPVDVAAWARALAGKRKPIDGTGKPITSGSQPNPIAAGPMNTGDQPAPRNIPANPQPIVISQSMPDGAPVEDAPGEDLDIDDL